jgi:hypothetical protein
MLAALCTDAFLRCCLYSLLDLRSKKRIHLTELYVLDKLAVERQNFSFSKSNVLHGRAGHVGEWVKTRPQHVLYMSFGFFISLLHNFGDNVFSN